MIKKGYLQAMQKCHKDVTPDVMRQIAELRMAIELQMDAVVGNEVHEYQGVTVAHTGQEIEDRADVEKYSANALMAIDHNKTRFPMIYGRSDEESWE